MYKTIRGFKGGVHFITQNIAGLKSVGEGDEFKTGILDNAQYLFIFNLSPNDINDLNVLFREIGGITEREKEFLASAGVGECIFSPTPQLRTELRINLTELEMNFFNQPFTKQSIELKINRIKESRG